ncbi:MAG: RNA polymerase subunit sigma [Rhodospirillaceae bacterium]|nr:RNA polymerase subunit sigma [Rhodospirillaceae bacterium]
MDQLLVAVATTRDRAAFRELFDYFAPRIKSFLMRQGLDAQAAEDVVQEAMVRVWQKAHQYDPAKARASTWMFTIARNLRVDFLRKSKRPEPNADDPALVPDAQPGGFALAAQAQDAARLKAALGDLPDEQRVVLELSFFEEMPHPEIAEHLGIPLGTVKSRIRLALKRVRSELGEDK